MCPISKINFTGNSNYKKGKQAFESLSRTERIGKIGAEMFRQNFNRQNIGFKLPVPKEDIGIYTRLKVSISNIVKKLSKK